MTDFSFTCSTEYIIFNVGLQNIKSDKQGAGLSPSTPKNLQTSFGMELWNLFTHNPFLLS